MSRAISAFVVASALLACSTAGVAQSAAKSTPVGIADGRQISVRGVSDITVSEVFFSAHRREPDPILDAAELAAIRERTACGSVKQAIAGVAFEEAKAHFGISVTDAELAAARQERLRTIDPEKEAAAVREHASRLAAALADVYERGLSPDGVYAARLVGTGVSVAEWAANVRLGRSEAHRKQLTRQTTIQGRDLLPSLLDVRTSVENQKLSAAIDREIGAVDPGFGKEREEVERSIAQNRSVSAKTYDNVVGKRREWWIGLYSRMSIGLTDSAFAERCGLTGANAAATLAAVSAPRY